MMHPTGSGQIPQPPSARPDPTAAQPNPNGVPTPPVVRSAAARRRVNKRGTALSVLVILLGGVIAFAAARVLTKHTAVLVVSRPVSAGSTISNQDLTTAEISSDPHLSPVKATDRRDVVGKIATVNLSAGELLTKSQFGTSDGFTAGQVLVALPLKDGQFPGRGLKPGQKVQVVDTPGDTANQDGTSGNNGAPTKSTQVFAATVSDVGRRNSDSQVTVIDVRVPADKAVSVAQLASTGNAAIVLLPPGK